MKVGHTAAAAAATQALFPGWGKSRRKHLYEVSPFTSLDEVEAIFKRIFGPPAALIFGHLVPQHFLSRRFDSIPHPFVLLNTVLHKCEGRDRLLGIWEHPRRGRRARADHGVICRIGRSLSRLRSDTHHPSNISNIRGPSAREAGGADEKRSLGGP